MTAQTAEYSKFTDVSHVVARSEMVPETTPTARVSDYLQV